MTTMKSMNTKTKAAQDIQGAFTYHKHYNAAQVTSLTGSQAREVLNAFEFPVIRFSKVPDSQEYKSGEAWTSRHDADMSFMSNEHEMTEHLVHV
ncbi:hypothetical protein [Paenibacillus aestuarii]|uniref:Uncharacterized protein n=1 Tax=Paenibacillus aestuarii TaxID=516965 RepID=A0ABW0KDH8_9BACL|nr:hypothetical protein [Paenibacillus aestuarii]